MKIVEVPVRPGDQLLVLPDIHFPDQDDLVLGVVGQIKRDIRPQHVLQVGDAFDSAGISRHPKEMKQFLAGGRTLRDEFEIATPYLADLAQDSRARMLMGNHENWWRLVQNEHPGLVGVDFWDLAPAGTFDGWHLYDEGTALLYGSLLAVHGHDLNGSLAQSSAATVLRNYPGQNTVYGHTHRIDSCTRPSLKYGRHTVHGAWSFGTLRDLSTELDHPEPKIRLSAERHENGVGVVTFGNDGHFAVETVRIFRAADSARAIFRGKEYVEKVEHMHRVCSFDGTDWSVESVEWR